MKLKVGFVFAAVVGGTWAYGAYGDYNVRDLYAQRIRLIPHDITLMAEQHKQNVDIVCKIILRGQQAVKKANHYLADQREVLRCAKIRARLPDDVDPGFAQSVLQQRRCPAKED
jgi:hypothetical protein